MSEDDAGDDHADPGRLDELGDRIEGARRQAEEADLLPDDDGDEEEEQEESFAESGERPDEDDQSIAPPG